MLQIYKASAGSGKTHTLTQDYLKLSFKYPDKFSRILAVTFTNKAAEEMKIRVIEELNNLIEKGKSAAHYKVISETYKNLSEKEIIAKSLKIRDRVLHNYSNFSISTIDSFVQRVVRAFAYEIKVPSGYKIEMDSAKVVEEITNMLFDNILTDKQLKKWLTQFAIYKVEQGKNWDFRDEIKKLAYEIFKEKFQSFKLDNQISIEQERENLNELLANIILIKKDFEEKMVKISEKSHKIISENGVNIDKLGRNFKTIANYLLVKINKSLDYEPNKTTLAALESEEAWYAKSASAKVKQTVLNVYPQLLTQLEDAFYLYQNEFPNYSTAKAVLQNFHSFGILNDISNLLPEYREKNNLLLISDTTVLLKKIIGGNEAPFIYEKIGTKFQNILIDEFQDTSGFQWFNFKPLVENSISNGFYNLIVGDIKQSIYRWRGGDWRLLLSGVKNDIGNNFLSETTLDTNWRSKRNIIDFNNAVFDLLPKVAQNSYNKELPTITEIDEEYQKVLTDAYNDTFQKLAPITAKTGGRVKINFIKTTPRNKAKKWREEITESIPETIDNLLKNKNYSPGDITILVRKNKEGKEIVNLLLDYMNKMPDAEKYDIISAESLFINNSPAVKILIYALKYLQNSEDNVNLTALIYEYQKLFFEDKIGLNQIFDSKNKHLLFDFLPEEFIKNYDSLKKVALYELIENLIAIFKLNTAQNEHPYLHTFQDVVLKYVKDEYSDLNNFLDWWNLKGSQISVNLSDKQDAVNVMTIHKSKGLAFKIVILPFLDWQLDHNHIIAPIIWCKPTQKPYDKFAYLPIKYGSNLTETHFQNDYFDEKLYAYMDAINMLYVAFTRPREELIAFAPTDGNDKITHISDLLYHTILNSHTEKTDDDNNKIIALKNYHNQEDDILEVKSGYKEIDTTKWKKDFREKTFQITDYPVFDWRNSLSIKTHSQDFFIESIKEVEAKVNYGKLMHEILSQVIVLEDIGDAVEDMIFTGKIDKTEANELKSKLRELLSIPQIKNWFSKDWKVRTEAEILSDTGEIKIPDRILFGENETVVIDFKFGEIRDEYKEQVAEYMKIVSQISPDKKVRGFLLYGNQKEVVEVFFDNA